jgi:hypothetical protein
MEYIYNVVVKSETSRNIPEAVKNLTQAQTIATNTFQQVTEFLAGEEFSETILEKLSEKLSEFKEEKFDLPFDEFFDPVIQSLQEIKAGLIVLMDLKEGDFANVYDTLRSLAEELGDKGTLAEGVTKLFTKTFGDIQEVRKKQIDSIISMFNRLTPTTEDIEGEYIKNEEGEEILTLDFLNRSIGNLDDVLEEYPDFLAKFLIAELNKFMDTVSETSGKKIFEEFIGEDIKDDLDALKQVMDTFLKVKGTMEKDELEDKEGFKVSEMSDFDKDPFIITAEEEWIRIRESFQEGLIKSIKEKGSPFLKDETTLSAIEVFIGDLFEKTREMIVEKINIFGRKRSPIPEQVFQTARKGMESGEFAENIKDYIKSGDDPFKIEVFKEHLSNIFEKSQKEANQGEEPLANFHEIFRKNLEEADLDEIFGTSIAAFLQKILITRSKEVEQNIITVFDRLKEQIGQMKFSEKVFEDLERLQKLISTDFDESTEDKEDKKTIFSIENIDFEGYFQKTIDNDDSNLEVLKNMLEFIKNHISDKTSMLDSRLRRVIDLVLGIPTDQPGESLVGSPKDLRPKIVGG